MRERIESIKRAINDFWINVFWKSPNHLWALKVMVSIAFLIIPAELIFKNSFIGTTMALGVVAMALGETDVHPWGRVKSAGIALFLFFAVSSIVMLTLPYPAIFAGVLALLAFSLVVLGSRNSRLQGVTFGSLLIIVYTMLGAENSPGWFHQPILYTIGAFCYSLISILLLFHKPYRLLQERLARGFHYLAEYIDLKSGLFPSKQHAQMPIRNQLAHKNLSLAQQIELCKQGLYSYSAESNDEARLMVEHYYRKWFLLQAMQERAMSSHEQYDLLTQQVKNIELLEGFGLLMREIAEAMQLYADSLLTEQPYKHPLSLEWTVSATRTMLEAEKGEPHYQTLSLLMRNLSGLEENLREEEKTVEQIDVTVFHTRRPVNNGLKSILTRKHPRFRYAVRLALGWVLGYALMQSFEFGKGSWILLTSLIVFQQTYSATRMRLFHRVFGTLLGVVLGVVLAHLLPTLAGQIVLLLVSIYLFYYWINQNYTIAVVFITTFVLAAFNLLANQGVAVMLPRIIETVIGGVLAYLLVRFVWPGWQYKQLPTLLLRAVARNKRYFESVYDGSVPEEDYLHNRRSAYNADNELTSAWKGMRLEPKKQKVYRDKAFNLSNLNHALLSYISALGVHKSAETLSEKERDFCRDVSGVLGYVTELLTNHADESHMEHHMQLSGRWDERMDEMMNDPENKRAGLIYNIAHVSRQLLWEASGIMKLYEG